MVLSAFLFYVNGISLEKTINLIRSSVPYFGHFSDEFSVRNWFKLWNTSYAARSERRYYDARSNNVLDLNKKRRGAHNRRRVPVTVKKGFDGLSDECIETISYVFRTWTVSKVPTNSFFSDGHQNLPIPLRTHDEKIIMQDLGSQNEVLPLGYHDVLDDPDLNYILQGVFDVPFNVI
jgi:hypothetical protein